MMPVLPPGTVTLYPLPNFLKSIWKILRPHRTRYLVASLVRLSGDIAWLYPPIGIASLITFLSTYHASESTTLFWSITILLCLTSAWRLIALYSAKHTIYRIAEQVELSVQTDALKHMLSLPIAWHERENTGNKIKRIQRGSGSYNYLLRAWINNIIEIGVNFVGITIILSKIDLFIGGLLVAYMAIYMSIGTWLIKPAATAVQRENVTDEENSGLIFEVMNNVRSIKSLGMQQRFIVILSQGMDELFDAIKNRIIRFQTRGFSLDLWNHIFRISVLTFIGAGIIAGRYDIALFLLFQMYFGSITSALQQLSEVMQQITVARLSVGRLQELFCEIPEDDGKTLLPLPHNWKKIEFRNVSFSYGNQAVLQNVSFTVKRGERVGIIGLSGAGKSTLFKLLLKEYDDYAGDILVDGLSLRTIDRTTYYKHVAVVLQDTEVFNFSLQDNVTITGEKDPSKNKALEDALRIAHIDDFLHKLPQGLRTLIGEKGIKLSGGEKQRVGIARALYRQPELLLLDEATSHLDMESEEKIRDSLHQFFQKVTALVIAHRLTTIREMDRIIVLEDGAISEIGTFDDLIQKQGRFFELWNKQDLDDPVQTETT